MSVSEFNDLPAEFMEMLKLRDRRFHFLEASIAIENDLKNNVVIRTLMDAVRKDADQAMEALSDCSPTDQIAVSQHLVKIRTLIYIRRTLDIVLRRGMAAEQAIRAEDEIGGAHEERD